MKTKVTILGGMQFNGDKYKMKWECSKGRLVGGSITEKVGNSTGSQRGSIGIR